ncbi:MAG TPA: hypothetical protein VM537_15605 [Anaerolineae bacterium]|nr:hypothetical protein [Anaerolineae bacterium]
MKFDLGVRERLVLLGILPAEGSLATIRIVRELREALSFSEAEHEDLQMKQVDNQIRWEEGAVPDKKLDIGPKAAEVIRAAIKKLDDEKKLTADHLDLCDLFEYEGK